MNKQLLFLFLVHESKAVTPDGIDEQETHFVRCAVAIDVPTCAERMQGESVCAVLAKP
jgi:hypothetical protein